MTKSLRFRLAAGALVAIAIALSLVWFVLGELFEDYVADRYVNEMNAVSDALGARLVVDGDRASLRNEPSDPRFQTPAGGRYWQISPAGSDQPLRSRSLWDTELSRDKFLPDLYCGFYQAEGPDGSIILVALRNVSFGEGASRKQFVIYTGFSKEEMTQALESYRWPLRLMLLVTGGILLLAAFFQSVVGLRPLSALTKEVAKIRTGQLAQVRTAGPSEVGPLVSELNLLLAERETAVERARARASDLAHGLKTPLTVLSSLVEDLPGDKREAALRKIELVRQRADRQLQATRMGVERMATTSLRGISEKLVSALSPVTREKGIDCRLKINPAFIIQVDPADAAEALGNILDNAVRFSKRRIEITASLDGPMIRVMVGDDGPGVNPRSYAAILERGSNGHDLINDSTGTGLGLAISSDIATVYGGSLTLGQSGLGGLEVTIDFPVSMQPVSAPKGTFKARQNRL